MACKQLDPGVRQNQGGGCKCDIPKAGNLSRRLCTLLVGWCTSSRVCPSKHEHSLLLLPPHGGQRPECGCACTGLGRRHRPHPRQGKIPDCTTAVPVSPRMFFIPYVTGRVCGLGRQQPCRAGQQSDLELGPHPRVRFASGPDGNCLAGHGDW